MLSGDLVQTDRYSIYLVAMLGLVIFWLLNKPNIVDFMIATESEMRKVTRFLLEKNGYRVMEASDGAEAVGTYAGNRDKIALVLTDIMMPLMDGLALARALRKLEPHVRIIGSTGYIGETGISNRMEELRQLGVTEILEKPYQTDTLLRALARGLDS